MKYFTFKTGRTYDTEQQIHVLLRDWSTDDDRFLRHDIVFRDASRGILGVIDFEDAEDRDDFFELFPSRYQQKDFIMGVYDNGNYKQGDAIAKDQMYYWVARCDIQEVEG